MEETTHCPRCNNTKFALQRVHIHPHSGKEMQESAWIGSVVGILILGCILNAILSALSSKISTSFVVVLGALSIMGGIAGAIIIYSYYRRAPVEERLVCSNCGNHWSAGEQVSRIREEQHLGKGKIVLPFTVLPSGNYDNKKLNLGVMDVCVYCGKPSTTLLASQLVHNIKDKQDKVTESWTFNLEFPYCAEHAQISKRNGSILATAFTVGGVIGILLDIAYFVNDPEHAINTFVKPFSFILREWWMGLLMLFLAFGVFASFVGFIVQFIVRISAGFAIKSLKDQYGSLLGVGTEIDPKVKHIILTFTRPESAVTYAELNKMAIAALTQQEVVLLNAQAHADRSEFVVAAQKAREEMVVTEVTCWFCEQDLLANGTPYNVVLYKGTGDNREEQTLWVPRCARCETVHRKNAPMVTIMIPISIALFLIVCVLIGVLGATNFVFWRWFVGLIVMIAGITASGVLVTKLSENRAQKEGTRVAFEANGKHNTVKELMDAGWKIDAVKTGKKVV